MPGVSQPTPGFVFLGLTDLFIKSYTENGPALSSLILGQTFF